MMTVYPWLITRSTRQWWTAGWGSENVPSWHPSSVLLRGDGVVGGARLEQELHPDAGLSLQDDAPPQPVLLRGDGDVGGARPERELHPDVGLSLQDDKSAGRLDWQALRPLPFHQPPSPAFFRRVTCVDLEGPSGPGRPRFVEKTTTQLHLVIFLHARWKWSHMARRSKATLWTVLGRPTSWICLYYLCMLPQVAAYVACSTQHWQSSFFSSSVEKGTQKILNSKRPREFQQCGSIHILKTFLFQLCIVLLKSCSTPHWSCFSDMIFSHFLKFLEILILQIPFQSWFPVYIFR